MLYVNNFHTNRWNGKDGHTTYFVKLSFSSLKNFCAIYNEVANKAASVVINGARVSFITFNYIIYRWFVELS